MAKKKVFRAGVIPFIRENDEIYMLFMKPSSPKYGGDVFQVAKGKFEDGESAEEAALREGGEELGLFKGNISELKLVGEFLGRITVFAAHVKDKGMFGDPHFETGETKWMTLDEFLADGRDLHKPVVKAAHRVMEKMK